MIQKLRKSALALLLVSASLPAIAQTKVGAHPAIIHPSALLELESTTQGLLPPRMVQVQLNAILSPAIGLLVYCLDCAPAGLKIYDGLNWTSIGASNNPNANYTIGTLNCTGSLAGTYQQGAPATPSNTKTVTITATAGGNYTASTDTVNGIKFSAFGTLFSTGPNTPVTLTANGTPAAVGNFSYTLSLGGQICSFNVTYAGPATFVCGAITNTLPATLTNGQSYTGSVTSPYTAGNGQAYPAIGIGPKNGLILTRTADTYASGGGNVTYALSGTYTGTTGQSIDFTLPESGCVVAIGVSTYTTGTLICTGALSGTYQKEVATISANTKVVSIDVATTGGYSATTTSVNGVTFAGTGSFSGTGTQNATLTASGTPITSGSFNYTVTLGSQTCTFSVSYAPAAIVACTDATNTFTPAGNLVNGVTYSGSYTLPYTAGNGTAYGATSLTQNGLTLTRTAGTYTSGGGNVVYNLTGNYTGSASNEIFNIIEGCAVSAPSRYVSTLAGSGISGSTNGSGTIAKFKFPTGVTVDKIGNVYVADEANDQIRKITPAGVVSTFAGSSRGASNGTGTAAQFSYPGDVATDSADNVYVADPGNNLIRKITPAGVVSTFAGSGTNGSNNGPGTTAQFSSPAGIAVDEAGNVYVAEIANHRIRKITPAGVVSTFAGSTQGFADGTGIAARFDFPYDVAVDKAGNVYVADQSNHRIRKITSAGVVSTFAGSNTTGSANGTGAAAQFTSPRGIAVDAVGNVYVGDYANQHIRKITPAGVVSTYAGSGTNGFANGTGSAAQFSAPWGITIDANGNVYVGDSGNLRIRQITP